MLTKILIVDDHDFVRHALRDWLAISLPNCALLEASSGEQAIELCRQEIPDIVLMDYSLPKINGIEATRRLRTELPDLQVVIISIHEDARYRTEAADAGVAHYIPKRIIQRELLPVLTRLLKARRTKP